MSATEACYVISVDEVMLTAPLEDGDFRYLADHILPNLRTLSDEEYMHGPAVILHTFARYSYILHRGDVYWCAEWEPGLVVVRFSPDGRLAWVAMRSPIPNFGGREPALEDEGNYDEDAENHQYNLVFNAWDAQFDAADREWRSFRPAEPGAVSDFQAALSHADHLGTRIQARYSGDDKFSDWSVLCKDNIRAWAGDGVRAARV
jgi:hypothetical protein